MDLTSVTRQQLLWFGAMVGPRAQAHDVTVVVEPLNVTRGECNVLTSVGESARYVRQVDHPELPIAGRRLSLGPGSR